MAMVINETFELGPVLYRTMDDFTLQDQMAAAHHAHDLMGRNGLLLGFIGSVWDTSSVRRILWLQHYSERFSEMGAPAAVVVREQPSTLAGFYASSPMPVQCLLLADVGGTVHRLYNMMHHAGLLLLDNQLVLRQKWLMPGDRVWPRLQEIEKAVRELR